MNGIQRSVPRIPLLGFNIRIIKDTSSKLYFRIFMFILSPPFLIYNIPEYHNMPKMRQVLMKQYEYKCELN